MGREFLRFGGGGLGAVVGVVGVESKGGDSWNEVEEGGRAWEERGDWEEERSGFVGGKGGEGEVPTENGVDGGDLEGVFAVEVDGSWELWNECNVGISFKNWIKQEYYNKVPQ